MGDERLLTRPPPDDPDPVRRLVEVVARLRGEGGCPWDREQTRATLRPYVLEEAHEVVEALDSGDARRIRGELGDLLFQVVLHAQLSAERGEFDFASVAAGLAEKLVRRHPHVFGAERAEDAAAVEARWEELKRSEHADEGGGEGRPSALSGIPPALPALARAQKTQERAARAGFEWPSFEEALAKVDEERSELRAAVSARAEKNGAEAVEAELGDLLFAVVGVARACKINAEDALRTATARFAARFARVEEATARSGQDLKQLPVDEKRRLWAEAKSAEA